MNQKLELLIGCVETDVRRTGKEEQSMTNEQQFVMEGIWKATNEGAGLVGGQMAAAKAFTTQQPRTHSSEAWETSSIDVTHMLTKARRRN